MLAKIKKNDTVMVIAGNDNGKTGKVVAVNREKGVATVEGINIQKKHQKARSAQQTSAIVDKLGPVDLSNLMLVCPACGKATRVAIKTETVNGKEEKVRVCKKCGAIIAAVADKKDVKKVAKKSTKKAKEEVAEQPATAPVEEAPVKKAPAKKAPAKKAEDAPVKAPAKKAPAKKAEEAPAKKTTAKKTVKKTDSDAE